MLYGTADSSPPILRRKARSLNWRRMRLGCVKERGLLKMSLHTIHTKANHRLAEKGELRKDPRPSYENELCNPRSPAFIDEENYDKRRPLCGDLPSRLGMARKSDNLIRTGRRVFEMKFPDRPYPIETVLSAGPKRLFGNRRSHQVPASPASRPHLCCGIEREPLRCANRP